MPQAIVDPDELRRFARTLKKFNSDMQDRLTVVATELAALGKTWRDQEHRKFAEEFEHHLKVMGRFTAMTERHIPYLLRKAELIDNYLQQR